MNIKYSRCSNQRELEQILCLQKKNLRSSITQQELESEGFLTVSHTVEILSRMNDVCAHVIAKSNDNLIGYALCMHPSFAEDIPILKPMFNKIDSILENDISYMAMGQICIAKSFRKMGVFGGLYAYMRDELKGTYQMIITEVDAENQRSLKAHYTTGFCDMLVYKDGKRSWHLIKWVL